MNTILRKNKPDSIFCSRTCRIASIEEEGLELPKALALMNVKDLKTMIQVGRFSPEEMEPMTDLCSGTKITSEEQTRGVGSQTYPRSIRFLRLSSEMFPFASHLKYGYDLSFADKELKEAGDLAKQYGHRLTTHPGQVSPRFV